MLVSSKSWLQQQLQVAHHASHIPKSLNLTLRDQLVSLTVLICIYTLSLYIYMYIRVLLLVILLVNGRATTATILPLPPLLPVLVLLRTNTGNKNNTIRMLMISTRKEAIISRMLRIAPMRVTTAITICRAINA